MEPVGRRWGATAASQYGPEILKRVAAARERVWLVSPYVTNQSLVGVVRACAAPSKRLVTRYNGSDIVAGATDLRPTTFP